MAAGAGAGGGAAAAAGAVIQAIRASGVIVRLDERAFREILERQEAPLVVTAPAGFLGRKRAWLTSYRGLAFHCTTDGEIPLPGTAEVIAARKLWVP